MRNKQTSKSSVLQRGVDYYIYTFAHIKKQWKHNKKLIKMANYRRQTMAMNRLGQPEKWDFLKVYLLGWFNFWTMWMYYLFKKSKKKVNSKFFLKKILFPMSRCWQDSGFSCSYFLSNRCYPTPRLSYCAHLQDSEAKGHETWLQPSKWNHRRWEKWEKPFQFIKT